MVKLDIISDPICPWCYIGKTKLFRALEKHPDHPFTIEWHPFQLNPDMPAEGMDRREYLELKFGGKEGAVSVYGQIAQAAEETGLNIDFAAIERTPNTMNAHRLIHWAGIEGKQTAIVDALFKAFFEREDIVLRLRPSYFPFTEPSVEVDVGYSNEGDRRVVGGHGDSPGHDWMELGGSGMVNRRVLEFAGIDADKYQGFAFGLGIDRIAMLKYGMNDLRAFFDGDPRWLSHYGFSPYDQPTLSAGVGVRP